VVGFRSTMQPRRVCGSVATPGWRICSRLALAGDRENPTPDRCGPPPRAKRPVQPRARFDAGSVHDVTMTALPAGFRIGHWTDPDGRTGCTVVIPPPGARGGVDIRGGGTGTREIETLSPLANAEGPTAVLLTGGSAFGLAAADGVARWLEERGFGRPTPMGTVPLVPAAVIYDLAEGGAGRRPGPDEGYAACDNASASVPERGPVGAGAGAAVGKLFGRERSTRGGVGYAATALAGGGVVAAIAVANAFGDVIAQDGAVLGGPRDEGGRPVRTADLLPGMTVSPVSPVPPSGAFQAEGAEGNTTLVCVLTDASLDKRSCAIVARMASAGIARAVDPVFTPVDGDVVFCVASGSEPPPAPGLEATWALTVLGTVAASTTAQAIRDAVRARP
jgi:L-aminopeptidase/D-esterase-like protein